MKKLGKLSMPFLKVQIMRAPVREDWFIEPLIGWWCNLKGLDFDDDDTGIECKLLHSIGHRLQYLAIYDGERHFSSAEKAEEIDFANLRQLRQQLFCKPDSIRIILETAVYLEKLRLIGATHLVNAALTKCKKLKYLEIDAVAGKMFIQNTMHVLRSLEQSLLNNNTVHKEFLKIRINTLLPSKDECKGCIEKLDRVINILSNNKGEQWMLVLHLQPIHYSMHRDELRDVPFIQDLRQRPPSDISDMTVLEESGDINVLITNPGYPICGWRESWLMNL